ncbi:hypothetical protein IC757_11115 [Wenzhouxiangella sp. AB-CW3]|uniref:hypothetical protein n=1 Tax=Wenzhouxiangella sp. AB-CW3 TaxID=2771012 RepID=UPI00168BEE12|nr:hypothetical protein [Wenzhouxiangella sp. AB-CW3]QOC21590.1 hypothetical protein IC757_11115 [Wenzhouxiangella sp. AB-CW3]
MTLERQAFDAHMRITNGLDTVSLDQVDINVWFQDSEDNPVLASSDPDNTDADFFITLDSISGVGGIDGSGSIAPGEQADIYWLIIPAPGAGGGDPQGELYQVGATLSYSVAGEVETMEVAPDFIQVQPMPMLTLDYFLPAEVIGEDPLEPGELEPLPFPLAVRVTNSGYGAARQLAIESAQPRIVDNAQGLPITFELLSTQVDKEDAVNSLLAEFGDLEAGESAIAVWTMVVSLYGHFIDFSADYYHSDSLGGELTSLIESVNTHTLHRTVMNDMPGRDQRVDFLVDTGHALMLYESEGFDSSVTDQSEDSSLQLVEQDDEEAVYQLQFPETNGPVYAELTDPTGGDGVLTAVWRSDGKRINPINFGQVPTKDSGQWEYRVHLFDTNSDGTYELTYSVSTTDPESPALIVDADSPLITSEDGGQTSFTIELSSEPSAPVQIPVASSDASEGEVSPELLTLTADNWDQPQQVTVTGVDDDLLDGDVEYEVLVGPTSSDDADFDGLVHDPLPAINLDNDEAGLQVLPDQGLATAGDQSGARFRVALAAAPLQPLTIDIVSSRPEWGEPLADSLVLDQSNWQSGAVVEVEGRSDPATPSGTHPYHVAVSISGGDPAWQQADDAMVDFVHRADETWSLAAGRLSLPQVTGDSGFKAVQFDYPFDATPVVMVIGDDGEENPASVRLRNVDRYGFEIAQVQPPSAFTMSAPTAVHFVAVEQGRYLLPGGGVIEAGVVDLQEAVDVDTADHWLPIAFESPFEAAPLILSSLQSMRNESADVPQMASEPWLTAAVRAVSSTGFDAALERSAATQGAVAQAEELGWIAWHGSEGAFAADSGLVSWLSPQQAIEAVPWSDGCGAGTLIPPLSDDAIVVAKKQSRHSSTGGWLRLCTGPDGAFGFLVDQDVEQDDERGELEEEVGSIQFDRAFHTRLPLLLDALFRDAFESEEP